MISAIESTDLPPSARPLTRCHGAFIGTHDAHRACCRGPCSSCRAARRPSWGPGERLHVVRSDDGSIIHLVCATFVYTQVPYDLAAPIPGGHP